MIYSGKGVNRKLAMVLAMGLIPAIGSGEGFVYEPPIEKCGICGNDCPPFKRACSDEHWKLMNPRYKPAKKRISP